MYRILYTPKVLMELNEYDIDDSKKSVILLRIGHRKEVYKKK